MQTVVFQDMIFDILVLYLDDLLTWSKGEDENSLITHLTQIFERARKFNITFNPEKCKLGLEEIGVAMERGRIIIDDHFATNIEGIYAIGDVVRGPMLAHKAEDEGIALAEILSGEAGHVNYHVIPSVVYTTPEVAAIGLTEEEAKSREIPIAIGKFPFSANGRARAMRETDGLVKIIAHAETDRVLGMHIIGASAGELIAEAAVLMEFSGSSEDLARTCHAHPTLSEAVREAALAVARRALHI
jgi:dihydrolipoamide dehydrogenase